MIVIGVDPHKASHTACAVDARTGELRAELSVSADRDGHARLLAWARAHGDVLLFAIEDCRHVSANLERLLLARGEEVVRVPPHVAAGVRKRGRRRGKSDGVDALAVARAALQEADLPRARLAGIERQVRLLVDHREDLVAERRRHQLRLRWHLHELEAPARIPPSGLNRPKWASQLTGWLAGRQGLQARLARELLERIGALTRDIGALDREIAAAGNPRLRCPDGGQADRRDRRRGALCDRGQAGHARRRGAHPGIVGNPPPPSAQPSRQPPDQRRPAPHRRQPGSLEPADPR